MVCWFANSCLGAKHRQILNLVPFYNVKDSIYHFPASWGAVSPVTAEAQTAHTDVFWGKCYQAQPTCNPWTNSRYFWSLLISLASSLLQASVVENTTIIHVTLLSQGTMHDKFFWQFLQLCTLTLEVSLSRPSNTEAARTMHLFPPTSIYCPHEENQVGPWK